MQTSPTEPIVIYDVKQPLFGGGPPMRRARTANFDNLARPEGNLLQFSETLGAAHLALLTLRSAELVWFSHSELGMVHGNLGPDTFCLTTESITLLDVGLYTLAQQSLDRIKIGPGHGYKARRELQMSRVFPTRAMDLHSWGKMIYSLYTRSPFRASIGGPVVPLVKPQVMPGNIWNIVSQCLSEDLDIQVDMQQIISQLSAII